MSVETRGRIIRDPKSDETSGNTPDGETLAYTNGDKDEGCNEGKGGGTLL